MEKYIIDGGYQLNGEISIYGAKNEALKIIASSILLDGQCTIKNIPEIEDINRLVEILVALGAKVERAVSYTHLTLPTIYSV